jgi:hypothetical protein
VRLKTAAVTSSLSHIHPLHYFRASDQAEAGISIIPAQVFTGLDETSPGYKLLDGLTKEDSIIVSMPVAQWMAKYMESVD